MTSVDAIHFVEDALLALENEHSTTEIKALKAHRLNNTTQNQPPTSHRPTRPSPPTSFADKPITASTGVPNGVLIETRDLADMGIIDLDKEVGFNGVTVAMLMAHLGGTCTGGFMGYDRKEVAEGKTEVPKTTMDVLMGKGDSEKVEVIGIPGLMSIYSGGGTTILQLLIETVTGKTFPDAMRDLIFIPLGMTSSTFNTNPVTGDMACGHSMDLEPIVGGARIHPEMAAAGLWSTAEDMARFLKGYWESLAGVGGIIGREGARRMLERQGLMGEERMGWMVEGEKEGRVVFQHGGANDGYTLAIEGAVSSGEGYILFTSAPPQSRDTHYIRYIIRTALYAFYNHPNKPTKPTRPSLDDTEPTAAVVAPRMDLVDIVGRLRTEKKEGGEETPNHFVAEKPCRLGLTFEKTEGPMKMNVEYSWNTPMVFVKRWSTPLVF
ncbi:beta-lactamase/transpeptidase-like protein [Chytridium lagenaria]|nr:beta-lactamase/transpeptidase-like protein [Chytridium lagenaria]